MVQKINLTVYLNPKSQVSNPKETPISNDQAPRVTLGGLKFEN
jgi:hypothetical protein